MIEGGRLFAIPYQIDRGLGEKDIERNHAIINHLVEHPLWFASSLTAEEIRMNAVWMASDPGHAKWEIWNGGRLAGMFILSRVVAPVDALFHFTLLPREKSGVSLFAAKRLIYNFLGFAFEQFGLRRISMEIPEHYPTLIKFARQKLGFRYESELNHDRFDRVLRTRVSGDDETTKAQLALHGSRKEASHLNPKTGEWGDVILLRLMRTEYLSRSRSEGPTRVSEGETLEPRT